MRLASPFLEHRLKLQPEAALLEEVHAEAPEDRIRLVARALAGHELEAALVAGPQMRPVERGHPEDDGIRHHDLVAHRLENLAPCARDADAVVVPRENASRNARRGEPVPLELERHAGAGRERSGGVPPLEIAIEPRAPVAVEAVTVHRERLEKERVAVEIRREPEGRPVMADPKIGESGFILEEGVVDLELELALGLAVIGDADLKRERPEIPSPAGEPPEVVETDARLLHGLFLRRRIIDGAACRRRPAADGLGLEVEEGALGAPRERREKEKRGDGARRAPRRRNMFRGGAAAGRRYSIQFMHFNTYMMNNRVFPGRNQALMENFAAVTGRRSLSVSRSV